MNISIIQHYGHTRDGTSQKTIQTPFISGLDTVTDTFSLAMLEHSHK